MSGDGRTLREAAVADLTAEGFLAGVGSHVRRKVGRLAEGLVAVVAAVGTLARVRPHVGLERAGPRVRLAAHPAKVRFGRYTARAARPAPARRKLAICWTQTKHYYYIYLYSFISI